MSAAAAIEALRDAYPRASFPDRTVLLYGRMLGDLDERALTNAVRRLVHRSAFLPSIAEIRREVAEEQLGLPTAEEAWDIACQSGSLLAAPPEVKATVNAMGGRWNILHSERPETMRSQFKADYEARRQMSLDLYSGARVPMAVAPVLELPPSLAALPESSHIRPRPVMSRLMRRWAGRDLEAPSDEEKSDAIDVLRVGYRDDPIYQEAERIFEEGAA